MTTLWTFAQSPYHTSSSSSSSTPSTTAAAPTAVPSYVYRVHHNSAQTRYTFSTGFTAKNQTTVLSYTSALSRFGLAHLNHQTNISSPFISVYDNQGHAENVARHLSQKYGEDTCVVKIDTQHLARGPLFRAADLLSEANSEEAGGKSGREMESKEMREWLHWGEYLVMYRIPAQAVRDQTPIARGADQRWRTVGAIGGS